MYLELRCFRDLHFFTATWFVYKAFGLSGQSAWLIILLQSTISVSVDMLPLPGGMGISEKAVPGYLCTNLWNGAASSGNDFKQRTWILYRAACKCSTYDRG